MPARRTSKKSPTRAKKKKGAAKKAKSRAAASSRVKRAVAKSPARGASSKKRAGAKSAAAAARKTSRKSAAKKVAAKKKAVAKKAAPKRKTAPKKAVKKKSAASAKARSTKPAAPKKAAKKKSAAPAKVRSTKPAAAKKAAKAKPATPKPPAPKKKPARSVIPQIDRPTGMYNGVLLCEHVKPFPSKTPYSKKELAELKKTLLDERARLKAELDSIHRLSMEALDLAKDHPGYSVHMAEHATDLQTAETNLGVRTIEEARLEAVEAALERIQKNVNHYGLCLACGNKIGIQRLKARPHAHLCMDCRQRYERVGARRGF